MITSTGKNILSKYLIGQTSSYASHIAIGCGSTPLSPMQPFGDYSSKTSLDLEVARVPIISRGYELVDGVENIVFAGQLPSTGQYDITEIGVYSSSKNPSATGVDSRGILFFDSSESWEIHDATSSSAVPLITTPLDSDNFLVNSITALTNKLEVQISVPSGYPSRTLKLNSRVSISGSSNTSFNLDGFVVDVPVVLISSSTAMFYITPIGPMPSGVYDPMPNPATINLQFNDGVFTSQVSQKAFFVTNNNSYFSPNGNRKPEKPRVGENTLMVRADSSALPPDSMNNAWHVHLNNFRLDLSKNLPTDELRLGFSITDTSATDTLPTIITSASFSVEFSGGSESDSNRPRAVFTGSPQELEPGHYVVSTQLQDLEMFNNFSWQSVNMVRIWADIEGPALVGNTMTGQATPAYLIFDYLRLENTSTVNPLYGLTGYSVIKNTNANPVAKLPNTTSLVEFRFALDISSGSGMP